jgi:hypothetical protein
MKSRPKQFYAWYCQIVPRLATQLKESISRVAVSTSSLEISFSALYISCIYYSKVCKVYIFKPITMPSKYILCTGAVSLNATKSNEKLHSLHRNIII